MKEKQRILVVDDEQSMREFLSIMLSREGYQVELASDGQHACQLIDKTVYDLILSDIRMPNLDGLSLLARVKEQGTDTTVIMMTAFSTTEQAVEAMKQGAYDYLTKPFKNDEIRLVIRNALQHRQLRKENSRLRQVLDRRYAFDQLIGKSTVMQQLYRLIEKVSISSVNVLISGESGTGKELVARSIHFNSHRREEPFVAVNCGAIPENLLESELFGHEKGAFSGAISTKLGLFESAEGGTLFLDEVGELPQPMQVKFLRALQEKQIRRVGGNADINTDVRIVAATNISLEDAVTGGEFRKDLYYRLNVIHLHLPSLRERIDDIPLLVKSFCDTLAPHRHITIATELMQRLLDYPWPGNVRELENVIERCLILEEGDVLTGSGLPPRFGETSLPKSLGFQLPEEGLDLEAYMESIEREILQQALDRCQGVRTKAAELLHVSFRSLRYRLEKLGL
ncbi:sigma-54 dependent transcriptional regulator [uncultured Desulfuromonas sp.]|uniref:sigma-54-dependent transcriptional regulator n=1 Tax=uncultured Desulfuromonas sp. TaxID=181013 RepID=UPI002AAC33C6|nr:sigma-54 dependent transcriptional regulator [uncultured Desulfuromonas sp.]